jgi:hypothetical protein
MPHRARYGVLIALALSACGPLVDPTGPSSANRAPEIRGIAIDPPVVPVGGSGTITVDAVDPDGERLFFRFSAGAGTVSVPDPAQPGRAVYVHGGGQSASDLLVVSVTDPRNATSSRSSEIRLRRNSAPMVRIRSSGSCHPRCTVTFTAEAFDDEDDSLTYEWHGCATGTQSSASCEITAPTRVSASVVVSDGRGAVTTAFADAEGTNLPPVVAGGGQVRGVPALFHVTRTDPDGDDTDCGWTGDCQCTGNQSNFDLTCDMAPSVGACTMVFRCHDPFGARADTTFNLSR